MKSSGPDDYLLLEYTAMYFLTIFQLKAEFQVLPTLFTGSETGKIDFHMDLMDSVFS